MPTLPVPLPSLRPHSSQAVQRCLSPPRHTLLAQAQQRPCSHPSAGPHTPPSPFPLAQLALLRHSRALALRSSHSSSSSSSSSSLLLHKHPAWHHLPLPWGLRLVGCLLPLRLGWQLGLLLLLQAVALGWAASCPHPLPLALPPLLLHCQLLPLQPPLPLPLTSLPPASPRRPLLRSPCPFRLQLAVALQGRHPWPLHRLALRPPPPQPSPLLLLLLLVLRPVQQLSSLLLRPRLPSLRSRAPRPPSRPSLAPL